MLIIIIHKYTIIHGCVSVKRQRKVPQSGTFLLNPADCMFRATFCLHNLLYHTSLIPGISNCLIPHSVVIKKDILKKRFFVICLLFIN